jgi:hypothetical protein
MDEPMTATSTKPPSPDDAYPDWLLFFPNGEPTRIDHEKTFRFGKYRGYKLGYVLAVDPGYVDWVFDLPWFEQNHKRLVRAVSPRPQVDKPKANPVVRKPYRRPRPSPQDDQICTAPLRDLDQTESLPPPPRASRDVTVLAGGCSLIRPAAWNRA